MTKIVKEYPQEFENIRFHLEKIKYENPFQLIHERSHFLFSQFKKGVISSDLYNFLCENQYVDIDLTIYWQKQGYENLCCTLCVYSGDKKNKKVCICRVPRKSEPDIGLECTICKCMGCGG